MTPRDPKTHPRPGDVLRSVERGTVTVTSLSPRLTFTRDLWPDGMTTAGSYTARRWRIFAAELDVVTVADCPFWPSSRFTDSTPDSRISNARH